MRLLNRTQEALLQGERKVLNDLQIGLARFDAEPQDLEALSESIQQLDDFFLLVVVGEYNSGKSAVINAMLGQRVLDEGVTPTTTQISILRYGPEKAQAVSDPKQQVLTFPLDLLSEISIVDTPGTNAIVREHEMITSRFIPRADLVLFITSADRPFTESERVFLELIREWGKKVIFVINKIDILRTEDDIKQIEAYVRENAFRLLGSGSEIFTVSARTALQAKQGRPDLWKESGFETLEKYIYDTLDEVERLRLKLLNPIGVGARLAKKYDAVIDDRLSTLKADTDLIADVEAQLTLYREDMHRDFSFRMADIENILLEMERRGQDFFDSTFRLARVFDLLSKSRVQQEFERQVVADLPHRIERKVEEIIEWIVESDLRQWQAVNDHLSARRSEHAGRLVDDAGGPKFRYDRNRLVEGVGREARRVIETYDRTREASAIADGALAAVTASLAVEAGAVGLGTLITFIATTAAADVTGVLMAGSMAVLGLLIIPAKRRHGKAKLREKVAEVRSKLVEALQRQFAKEIEGSLLRINEAIGPYTRFIRSEKEKLTAARGQLENAITEMERLRSQIGEI